MKSAEEWVEEIIHRDHSLPRSMEKMILKIRAEALRWAQREAEAENMNNDSDWSLAAQRIADFVGYKAQELERESE